MFMVPNRDLSSSSDSDSDFIPSSVKGKDEKVRRSRREKKFCSLSEIDKAKLKNRPFAEREQAYQEIQGGALSSIDCTDKIERGKNLQLIFLFSFNFLLDILVSKQYRLSGVSSKGRLKIEDIPRSKNAEKECVDID